MVNGEKFKMFYLKDLNKIFFINNGSIVLSNAFGGIWNVEWINLEVRFYLKVNLGI